jgi:acetyl esterase/lipase
MGMNKILWLRLLGVVLLVASAMSFALESKAIVTFEAIARRPHQKPTHIIPYGTQRDQFAQLWLPDGKGPFPVMVLIHGGCWLESINGLRLMPHIAEDLRKSGIAVWSIEYRRLGVNGGGYPGTFLDVATAIDHLREVAKAYPLDLTRVVITGHSAGGHLALWAASRRRIARSSAVYTENPLSVRAAISLAGVNDLDAYRSGNNRACSAKIINQLVNMNGRSKDNYFADTSPAAMLPLGVPQVIVTGMQDPIVPAHFASDYAEAAKKAGDDVTVISADNAGHFDVIDPESRIWKPVKAAVTGYLF